MTTHLTIDPPVERGDRGADRPLLPDHIPSVSLEHALAAFSLALDLAEGREQGHALRVCYIATALAQELGLNRTLCQTVFLASLMHDIGVPHASETVSGLPRVYEHDLFAAAPAQPPQVITQHMDTRLAGVVTEAFHEHSFEGATAAASLGLPPAVAEAILCHHERYAGGGYPLGLSGGEIPMAARVVAVADYAESLLSAQANPLLARRCLETALRDQAGSGFDPSVVAALTSVIREDAFWLGFHHHHLTSTVIESAALAPRPLAEPALLRLAASFADVVDAKSSYKRGHSRRVALYARALATAIGLAEPHVRALELAALLHDVGMVGVPSRIIGKPEILSVEEMSLLHEHPHQSAAILRAVPGWGGLAGWVALHHERLDGRGYPEELPADQIPMEARIIAIADIFEALTAQRPHRAAQSAQQALQTMEGMSGVTVDGFLLSALAGVVLDGVALAAPA